VILFLNDGVGRPWTIIRIQHKPHLAAGSGRLRDGGAQEACWRGRALDHTGRHPAADSGRLRGCDAQAACLRGRPLDCMGCHLAAGSGQLRDGAHRKLAGVDELYTALAAIRQPALAGCWMAAHRKLAGVDDL
jgi:hypothetical protein